MEVYAGYSENADYNAGRVIDAIDELGELDNTLVLWIWGDNGASMEGTITGSFNELTMQNGIPLTDEMQLQLSERYGGVEAWGNQMMAPHYSAAWAWAGNTPFKWGKQVGSHLGGTRNPLVAHWPERISEAGALRSHFTHVIDIGPTILDIAGHPDADPRRRGRAGADARGDVRRFADRRRGPRAAHPAVLRDDRQPGDVQGRLVAVDADRAHPLGAHAAGARSPTSPGVWDPDQDPVELYYLPDDFSQANDLAAEHPEKVQELKELFWQEAEKYKVLPLMLDAGGILRHAAAAPRGRHASSSARDVQNVLSGMIPRIYNHSYSISADLVIPAGRRRGCDRRRGRSPGRLLALRRRRQAHPHLLDDGRLRLAPAGDRGAPGGRGDGADGVRRRLGTAGDRRSR